MPAVAPAHGFMLVTVDPHRAAGGRGGALQLVMHRLGLGLWPLYERTPNRSRITAGAPLAFYVGGERELAGHVVATAAVAAKVPWSEVHATIDPPRYLTDPPTEVLRLEQVRYLHPPVNFRETLESLSIRPRNLRRWGVVLMGGVRALGADDWARLLEGVAARDTPFKGAAAGCR